MLAVELRSADDFGTDSLGVKKDVSAGESSDGLEFAKLALIR